MAGMTIAAIVTAAGRSSRMGRPKALLDYRGQSFVARIAGELLACGVRPVVVVGAAGDRELATAAARAGARYAVNPDPDRGMLSSVLAGFEALAEDRLIAFLLWPVDYPAVRRETVAAILEAYRRARCEIVVPVHAGHRGHPVLFDRTTFADLRAAPMEVGARAVVRAHAAGRVEVEVADPAIHDDIDTPEDLARLLRDEPACG